MTANQVAEQIQAAKTAARDLSLYFHLPFCRSLCWYCGCTTVTTTRQSASAQYLAYLEKEMALMGPLLNPARRVVQIHLGGGTPTFLLPDELRHLGGMIAAHFAVAADVEASVEVDPRRLSPQHAAALRDAGFRRASLGVQDFDPRVQAAINRYQTRDDTARAVRWLRGEGFESLNLDLVYGLPRQTAESFAKTLDEAIAMRPNRIAAFSYAHVPWVKPAQRKLEALPTPETKLELLHLTVEKLSEAGFVHIGMDHFARADDELAVAQRERKLQRNFQGYSTRGHADIFAFGMSSISQVNGAYWQNLKTLPGYYQALDASRLPIGRGYVLSDDDKIRREVIMRVMCDLELDYVALSARLGIDFQSYFAPELASLADLEADGLVETGYARLSVTEAGRFLIRVIASRFDAYFAPACAARQFSQTV
jgi:oxygen-independent coproporphyrinogen-3 oxidase